MSSQASLQIPNQTQSVGTFKSTFKSLWQLASKKNKPLTHAQQSEKLRAYAFSLRSREPSYAKDLYAAADRHEWPIDQVSS